MIPSAGELARDGYRMTHDGAAVESQGDVALSTTSNDRDDPIGGALLTFLEGVHFHRPSTVYISTPITTGPWFYAELAQRGARGEVEKLQPSLVSPVRKVAMAHNREVTHESLLRLMELLPAHSFINPANLHVASWTQDQYIRFWLQVIERSVGRVVFSPGWEYSTGCTHECARAIAQGIPTFDTHMEPIPPRAAFNAVNQAIGTIEKMGLEPSGLIEAVKGLEVQARR